MGPLVEDTLNKGHHSSERGQPLHNGHNGHNDPPQSVHYLLVHYTDSLNDMWSGFSVAVIEQSWSSLTREGLCQRLLEAPSLRVSPLEQSHISLIGGGGGGEGGRVEGGHRVDNSQGPLTVLFPWLPVLWLSCKSDIPVLMSL